MLEKTLESPLDSEEIKAVNPKGNQHEYSLKGLMLKPPDVKSQFIGKNSDAGKIEGRGRRGPQRKKGAAEDEMVGWHHRLNGHEFEQTMGDSGGQRSLSCHSP